MKWENGDQFAYTGGGREEVDVLLLPLFRKARPPRRRMQGYQGDIYKQGCEDWVTQEEEAE